MSKRIIAQDCKVWMGIDQDMWGAVVHLFIEGGKEKQLRVGGRDWPELMARLPGCEVMAAYEAGPFGYGLHEQLTALGVDAMVAAPSRIPREPGMPQKTDKRDARDLAAYLAARRLSPVHVPEPERRALRALVRHRSALVRNRTAMINRLKGLLRFHGVDEEWIRQWRRNGLENGELPAFEHDADGYIRYVYAELLFDLSRLEESIERAEERIAEASEAEAERSEQVKRYTSIPGIGLTTAMLLVAELGDLSRFPKSQNLAGYLGLTPGEYSTGGKTRRLRTTHKGNEKVRSALIESAWTWVRWDDEAKKKFEELSARRGKKRAVAAMARRLAVKLWWMEWEARKARGSGPGIHNPASGGEAALGGAASGKARGLDGRGQPPRPGKASGA